MRVVSALLAFLMVPSTARADEAQDLLDMKTQLGDSFAGEWQILAVCGMSSGKSYFMQELHRGWQDDQISSGNLIFLKDETGKPDVLFIDSTQGAKSATLEGASVFEVFARDETSEYVWVVVYPSTGTTETYTLSIGAEPVKLVMWSQGRPSVQLNNNPRLSIGAKVAAFVARCA